MLIWLCRQGIKCKCAGFGQGRVERAGYIYWLNYKNGLDIRIGTGVEFQVPGKEEEEKKTMKAITSDIY